jgi:hypothetical protein
MDNRIYALKKGKGISSLYQKQKIKTLKDKIIASSIYLIQKRFVQINFNQKRQF